jgi:hypothetical protein
VFIQQGVAALAFATQLFVPRKVDFSVLDPSTKDSKNTDKNNNDFARF